RSSLTARAAPSLTRSRTPPSSSARRGMSPRLLLPPRRRGTRPREPERRVGPMLYQIHRYPADLIDVVRLRDDRRVLIRPVLPQDEDITSAFFGKLPARARYDRFMAPMPNLPPELIKRFTHIDYASHLALVAEIFAGGRETVVAEARYARATDPSVAEFAVAVADDWQGQGL